MPFLNGGGRLCQNADNTCATAEEFLQENLHGPSPADNRVLLNFILTAYARRGNTEQATRVFEQICSPRQ
jgi:pentatricopeptide repeat protein